MYARARVCVHRGVFMFVCVYAFVWSPTLGFYEIIGLHLGWPFRLMPILIFGRSELAVID